MEEQEGEEQGFEQKLEVALSSRAQHLKENTDTLTLGSVRRLLEKDLGLQKFALDAHKNFIREYLTKELKGTDDGNTEEAAEDVEKHANLSQEEISVVPEQLETKNSPKDSNTEDEKIMEDSPIMGVLAPKSESGTRESTVDEGKIKKAIQRRADYFLANSESTTLVGVRRLLEEDLGLEKNVLDSFKKFISQEIDKVLNSPEKSSKSAKDFKKKASQSSKPAKDAKQKFSKGSRTKKSEKISSEEESGPSDSEEKPRNEAAPKRKIVNSKEPKKRKTADDDDDSISRKKQNSTSKTQKKENASDEDGSTSQDEQSQSSGAKQAQRNAKSAPGYGQRVDNLKSIIKACGMSIPPSIYKKAKQVPDDEREAFIVEELQGVLSKEGLSKNPSEKEIKDCRKRKERARELEGIDAGNIISSSRRRSTVSFMSPPPNHAKSSKNEKVIAKDKKKKEESDDEISDSNEKVKEAKKFENDVNEEKKDDEEEEEEDNDDDDDDEEDEESEEFDGDDDENSD